MICSPGVEVIPVRAERREGVGWDYSGRIHERERPGSGQTGEDDEQSRELLEYCTGRSGMGILHGECYALSLNKMSLLNP